MAKGLALFFCFLLSEINLVIGFQFALRTNFRQLQVTFHRSIDDGLMLRVKKPIFTRANIILAASPVPDPSLTVLRVALGKIFNSEREYCFSTRRNMRSYEWGLEESEELYDDLKDEAMKVDSPESREKDLGTIIILKSEWDKKTHGDGNLYDVHDGQQRLVTLSLLLAAFRDVLETKPDAKDTVEDLRAMLKPVKSRKEDILRVQMREREGTWLTRILNKSLETELVLPSAKNRLSLPAPERRVIENYECFVKSTERLKVDEAYALLDYIKESVFIMVSIPTDTRMARNMIMGQGKGKNTAPVDIFKAMVCFNNIHDDKEQDAVLNQWDRLSDDVGRKVLESACLLLAQAALSQRPRKNCEIDLLEDYLKEDLLAHGYDGKGFFEARVAPACRALKRFRDGAHDAAGRGGGAARPSLRFLRAACELPASKEVEMVVLQLLLRLDGAADEEAAAAAEGRLRRLERVALWMMLAKPDLRARCSRCFRMVQALQGGGREEGAFALAAEERGAARRALDETPFGATAPGRSAARAVLARLNEHELRLHSQCDVRPHDETLQVEHVLPVAHRGTPAWGEAWGAADPEASVHRLGNLVLLNQSKNAKLGNAPFARKREVLVDSPYPLTKAVGRAPAWDPAALGAQHAALVEHAAGVWEL
jgi:hypothetical protein